MHHFTSLLTPCIFLQCPQRDEELADRLEHYEHIGLSNRWNGPQEREKRSSSRHASNKVKIQLQDKNIGKYETLGEEVELLKEKKEKSLERQKEIDAQLNEIKSELTNCSRLSSRAIELKEERGHLGVERKSALEQRKEWGLQRTAIENERSRMRQDVLKGVRIQGSRPASSSPQKENLPSMSTASTAESQCSSPIIEPDRDCDDFFADTIFPADPLDMSSAPSDYLDNNDFPFLLPPNQQGGTLSPGNFFVFGDNDSDTSPCQTASTTAGREPVPPFPHRIDGLVQHTSGALSAPGMAPNLMGDEIQFDLHSSDEVFNRFLQQYPGNSDASHLEWSY